MTNALLSDLNEIPDPDPDHWINLPKMVEAFERQILQHALNMAGGNQTLAAKYCKINRTTFVEKINKYGIVYEFDQAEGDASFKHRMMIYAQALKDRAKIFERLVEDLSSNDTTRKKAALSIVE